MLPLDERAIAARGRCRGLGAARRSLRNGSKPVYMAQELEAEARPAVAALTFGDRVAAAVDAKRSQLLVGLDPRPELLPGRAAR